MKNDTFSGPSKWQLSAELKAAQEVLTACQLTVEMWKQLIGLHIQSSALWRVFWYQQTKHDMCVDNFLLIYCGTASWNQFQIETFASASTRAVVHEQAEEEEEEDLQAT